MCEIDILKTRIIQNEVISILHGAISKDTRVITVKAISKIHKIHKNEVVKVIKKLFLKNRLAINVNCLDVRNNLKDFCLNIHAVFDIPVDKPVKEPVFVLTKEGYIEVINYINSIHSTNLKTATEYFTK